MDTKQNLRKELSGALRSFSVEKFIERITDNPEQFPELYSLAFDADSKVSWRASWICEKISYRFPEWFIPKRSELIQRIMQCDNDGSKRSLLNILLHLPIEEPIPVGFLNFCMDHMLSPKEPVAIQAQCIKMAHKICTKEPELLPELKYILENTELEYYSKGIKATIYNTLKQLNSTKNKYV